MVTTGLYKIKKPLNFLNTLRFEQVFVTPKSPSKDWASFLETTFEHKKIDSLAIPLDLLPLEMPEGYIIGALSSRKDTPWVIEINPLDFSENKILSLKENSALYHPENVNITLLKEVRPDLNMIVSQTSPPKHVTRLTTQNKMINSALLHPISPEEIVPPTGSGIIGFVIKKTDRETRVKLLDIHDKTVVPLSNAERKAAIELAKLKNIPFNFYCEYKNGQYKILAQAKSGNKKVYSYISSTFLELDKFIIDEIIGNFEKG